MDWIAVLVALPGVLILLVPAILLLLVAVFAILMPVCAFGGEALRLADAIHGGLRRKTHAHHKSLLHSIHS